VHPEATHHVDRVVGGWFDSELTARGRADAGRIAHRLREWIPAGVVPGLVSSDLRRTRQTADAIAREFDVPVVEHAGLREKSYGDAHGRPQSWLDARFVFPPRAGERLDHDEGIPGAETKREWVERVSAAVAELDRDPVEHRIVVTHGGSASWVIAAWMRLPIDATAHAAFRTPTGSITVLRDAPPFHNRELRVLGDVSHLGPS
jgi:2,3-bisphosphoglycerate-dependent phosphoglycerate mutase